MTASEIILLITTILGIVGTILAAVIPQVMANKKQAIYVIKKDAILESLNFLDDYFSYEFSKQDGSPCKTDKNDLTFRGRACFNKLITASDNSELVDKFCQFFCPNLYGKEYASLEDYKNYRELCRKELGLKRELPYNDKIKYIGQIG